MYIDGDGYKHFIVEKQFEGTLDDLIEEIIEAFTGEETGYSKSGEFHVMAGVVDIEDYGDFTFHEGLTGFDRDYVLEEDTVRIIIERFFSHEIKKSKMEWDIDGRLKVIPTVMLDRHIKATYTLAYS